MPGPVYVSSVSAARRHGVYAIERTPSPSIRAIGTGVCAIVLQSPWGPDQALTTPSGLKDLYDTIAPAGMDRTWSGYRSVRTVYTDPWVYVLDDVDGTKRLVPSAPFAASVAAQLSPSTSIAWKDPEVLAMLDAIVDVEFDRGNGA